MTTISQTIKSTLNFLFQLSINDLGNNPLHACGIVAFEFALGVIDGVQVELQVIRGVDALDGGVLAHFCIKQRGVHILQQVLLSRKIDKDHPGPGLLHFADHLP